MAASLLSAAVLAGTGAGLGYALGRGDAPATPSVATADPTKAGVSTEEAVRLEVDRRLAAWEASHGKTAAGSADDPLVSASAMRSEFAKFERRLNGARASDLEYVLDEIAAAEYRVGSRLGKTNDALRTVALASNGYVTEQ